MKTTVKTASQTPLEVPLQEQSGPIVRTHQTWAPGDVAHQGDLIFVCIPEIPLSRKSRQERQLVNGSTTGSRHVLDGGSVHDCDPREVADAISKATNGKMIVQERYIGPVFSGPATVTHPQHQNQAFPAGTVTACVFQRNLDAEEREVRAQD